MLKKSTMLVIALTSLTVLTGCNLPSWWPSWLGGGAKPATTQQTKK